MNPPERIGGSLAPLVLGTLLSTIALVSPATAPVESSAENSAGAAAAPVPSPPSPKLVRLLDLLASRADLHRFLLYRFQCLEDLTRKVVRRPTFTRGGVLPEQTMHQQCGIVVERRGDGVASVVRVGMDRKGKVRLNRKGEPVETDLPREFDPVVKAVPQAQAALFTASGQEEIVFHLIEEMGQDAPAYRIKCPVEHMAIEFLDRRQPQVHVNQCYAQASGQICVDPHNGEISALVFYGLDRTYKGCFWNREAPFSIVEQGLVEDKTGARFPSRVQTIFSLSPKDNAVFDQRYENCGFTHVDVEESYGGVAAAPGHP